MKPETQNALSIMILALSVMMLSSIVSAQSLKKAIRVAHQRTVQLQVISEGGIVGGSGVSVGKGKVVTACHVIDREPISIIAVKQSGEESNCKVVRKDSDRDLALLMCDSFNSDTKLRLVRSNNIRIGTAVITSGSPSFLPIVVTAGIVSGAFPEKGKLLVDAAIGPGSSGGPVFTLNGKLLGVVQAILNRPPFLGFTTNTLQLRRFLHEAIPTEY